jgi:signal transduction histidine kinase
MTQARDSGTFALTAPVVLKQDETGANIAPPKSVLLYYPIYRDGLTPASTAERRERLVGYVYVAIRVKDMLAKQTNTLGTLGINYTLSDTTTASPAFIYKARAKTSGPLERIAQTVELGSRRWTVQLAVPKSVVGKQADPMFLFLYGLGASTILGALVFLLLRSRLQAVKTQHQTELQQTRDELLALTSHQLRTPASGVKQYLGMLRQGYFGELTDEQRTIAIRGQGRRQPADCAAKHGRPGQAYRRHRRHHARNRRPKKHCNPNKTARRTNCSRRRAFCTYDYRKSY